MSSKVIIDSLSYAGQSLEVVLLVFLFARGHWKRLWQITLYLAILLGVGAARSFTLHRYGFASSQYGDCYWTTDLFLVVAAFFVMATLFRRACSENEKMWSHLRLLLASVFLFMLALSLFSLSHHKGQFFTAFIIGFQQDLYFACLVLNTLLYLLVIKMEIADDQLAMLVSGLGIEFAGPAACLALFYLTGGDPVARNLGSVLLPLCDIGMILTWFYATLRVPVTAEMPRTRVKPSHIFAKENVSQF